MRLPSSHLDDERDRDVAMTPMIDVVFLLLVFFVVASAGQVQESLLPMELAASGAVVADAEPEEREPWVEDVWLRLARDPATGRTVVDMQGTLYNNLPRLKEQLRLLAQAGPEIPVILDIDADVPAGDLIDIYDTCKAAGFQSVNFAADAADLAAG